MHTRILVTGLLFTTLLIPTAALAQADVPERAAEAVAAGQAHARAEAKGENGTQGQENAAAALAMAAEKSNGNAGGNGNGDGNGNGNAFGKGHAAEVHAILLAGGSPSDLPPHGQTVSALAKAYKEAKGDSGGDGPGNNGKGLGHGKGGDGVPDEGDDD